MTEKIPVRTVISLTMKFFLILLLLLLLSHQAARELAVEISETLADEMTEGGASADGSDDLFLAKSAFNKRCTYTLLKAALAYDGVAEKIARTKSLNSIDEDDY